MKRYSNKLSLTMLAGLALLLFGCSDGDTEFDNIINNETRGAILRTVSLSSDEFPIGDAEAFFGGEFEVQDQENGTLVDFVEVYVGFRDNSVNGSDLSKDQVLYETLDADDFSIGEFGYPRFVYEISILEISSALGLDFEDWDAGDQGEIRFELVLIDGRRYSFADNTGTLTGSFFSSPFLYTPIVVCPPQPPTPGNWIFDLQDSYGDGWNGASLTVTIDDTENEVLLDDGFDGQVILDVPEGSEAISIIFNSGDWDSEITFQVTSANGNTFIDLGPNPPVGVELIDYCVLPPPY